MNEINVVQINRDEFSLKVKQHSIESGESLMDSILHICNKNNIEVEVASKLITKDLKELIEVEMVKLNLIKKNREILEFK